MCTRGVGPAGGQCAGSLWKAIVFGEFFPWYCGMKSSAWSWKVADFSLVQQYGNGWAWFGSALVVVGVCTKKGSNPTTYSCCFPAKSGYDAAGCDASGKQKCCKGVVFNAESGQKAADVS